MQIAIVRHFSGDEHFLAELDDYGDVTGLSAPLPIADTFGRDPADLTPSEWESFGHGNIEPWDYNDRDLCKHWTADHITVVHAF